MSCALTCFEPPVSSFGFGLDDALRAGVSRACAGPAETPPRIDKLGVRASQS
jgi:hypothetical protein